MKKWLFRIVWIPLLVIALLFLVSNNQRVALSFDPINPNDPAVATYSFPLWIWLMAMLFIGVLLGGVGAWFSARPRRVQARADRRELKELRAEVTRLETRLREAHQPDQPAENPPPLLVSENV